MPTPRWTKQRQTTAGRGWERKWRNLHATHLQVAAENTQLRNALDELNADVEDFLNIAHQAGHEEAKSWLIRSQRASIARLKARLKEKP